MLPPNDRWLFLSEKPSSPTGKPLRQLPLDQLHLEALDLVAFADDHNSPETVTREGAIIAKKEAQVKELPHSWQRLSKSEERAVLRHFMHGLSFSTHRNPEGQSTIVEPPHSVTYELRPMGTYLGEKYRTRARSMCDDYLRFFRSVIADDDFVIAYDHNHPSFKFWPHQTFEYENDNDWPVTPYPDGDYHAFFASNLKSCLYGFPWRPSVCVIGARFVEPMREWKPRIFGDKIRVGGKPCRQ